MNNEALRLEKVAKVFSMTEGFNGKASVAGSQFLLQWARGDSVLQLGCGDGSETEVLLTRFKRVIAVDGSPTMAEAIRKRFCNCPNVEVICSLVEYLDLCEELDTVWAHHILEHVVDPVRFIEVAKQFMSEDSILIAATPNRHTLNRRLGVMMGLLPSLDSFTEFDIKVGHRRVYSMSMLVEDFEKAGLRILHKGGYLLKPFSEAQMNKIMVDGLVEALLKIGCEMPEYAADIFVVASK